MGIFDWANEWNESLIKWERKWIYLCNAFCNNFSLLQQFSCHRLTGCSISGCPISGFPSRIYFNQSARGSESLKRMICTISVIQGCGTFLSRLRPVPIRDQSGLRPVQLYDFWRFYETGQIRKYPVPRLQLIPVICWLIPVKTAVNQPKRFTFRSSHVTWSTRYCWNGFTQSW